MIHQARNLVKPSTISGCFNHCGFIAPSISTDKTNTDEDIPDSTIIEQICNRCNVNFTDYLYADDELETSEPLTDDAIISIVQRPDDSDTENDDEFMPPPEKPPSHLLAIDMCYQLRIYLESQTESTNLFSHLNLIEQFLRKTQQDCMQQVTITKFTNAHQIT